MFNISEAYIKKLEESNITDRKVTGTIKLLTGEQIEIDNNILKNGSLTIDNRCSSNSDISLGSTYIGQLSISFYGDYDRYSFYKADQGGVVKLKYTMIDEIPLGVFNIYECTKKGSNISIKAYDNMSKLNKSLGSNNVNGIVVDVLKWIAKECGIEFANSYDDIAAMNNAKVVCNITSDTYKTYQNVLSDILVLLGCFAFANREGKIEIKSFSNNSCFTLTSKMRTSINPTDYDVFYTSLVATDKNNVKFTASEGNGDGLTYNISNPLITGTNAGKNKIVMNIMEKLSAVKYTPCEIGIVYNPIFDLGDLITVKADGKILKEDIDILITEYRYTYNGKSTIKSIGSNRFLLSSGVSNNSSAFSSAYNNLKNNGTYISTYKSISSYSINSSKKSIAYLEMETGESDKTALNGQCVINVTKAGTLKISYSINDVDDTFIPEQYLTTGKHIINFSNWFNLDAKNHNNVNYYDIKLWSSDGLTGTVAADAVRVYILSSAVSEGIFDINNEFVEIINPYTMYNNITPLGYIAENHNNNGGE